MRFVTAVVAAALVGTATAQVNSTQNDLNVLHYALTLEHLEATFYTTGQQNFTADNFTAAGYPAELYQYISIIEGHEQAHVTALTQVIQSLGGTPVTAGVYDFSGVVDVPSYLAYALAFESTGVSAYDGALNALTSPTLQQVAATIATVEARHTSYLALFSPPPAQNVSDQGTGHKPFPNAFETPSSPPSVAQIVAPYITQFGTPALVLPIERNDTSDYVQPTAATLTADIAILNYALTLEHLEATFYNTFVYNASQYEAAGYDGATAGYISMIQSHENTHVATLTSVITVLGGTPVAPCTYNFSSVTGVPAFLATAAALENTGVSAYDGAANGITNPDLQQAAATIATVEGRHASYLNFLNGVVPFPNITDIPLNMSQVLQIAGPFIVSCPTATSVPGAAPTDTN